MYVTKFQIKRALEEYGLGRVESPPVVRTKQLAWPAAPFVPQAPVLQYKHHYRDGYWGNQGNSSMCVDYSWQHYIHDAPVLHSAKKPMFPHGELYDWARDNDYWPGNEYEGTSVDAGAKFLKMKGVIKEFRWVTSLEEALRALEKWPLVVGVNWYELMFFPDKQGVCRIGGEVVGGHAFEVPGFSRKLRWVDGKQSWDRKWGLRGMFRITFDDFERLIYEQGEICLAIQNPK